MPRRTKNVTRLQKLIAYARTVLWRDHHYILSVYYQSTLNSLQFAYSIIVHGLGYLSTSLCFLENGILPPSHSTYYDKIDIVIDAIIKLCKECVLFEYKQIHFNTVIGLDGSWDHKRNGMNCIVVVIDQIRKKIIDFEIIRRSSKYKQTDYKGSPQGMETECVRRISQRLMNNHKIVGYVHDRDSSVTAYMKKNWPIREYIDRNHSVKCLSTYFKIIENICGPQDELFTHLHNFMNFLISYPVTPLKKVALWKNASKHYTGHHEKCIKHKQSSFVWEYANNDQAISALKTFLDKTSFILIKCEPPFSTQLNECYNSIKSHFLDKEVAWKKTAFARLCCAILDFNEFPNWRLNLRKTLNLPDLSPEILIRINNFERLRNNMLHKRRQSDYQQQIRYQRYYERNKRAHQDKSGYTGKPKNPY